MITSDVLQLVNLATSILFVPLVTSLWNIQGRLSKIEGRLESIHKEVRE